MSFVGCSFTVFTHGYPSTLYLRINILHSVSTSLFTYILISFTQFRSRHLLDFLSTHSITPF
ncbi:uncharacterized protein LACBIDRAFT_317925 [Laccaria bicolor S238N-H82]|uniref:Predicted protein n=1 Tax=Laccaria bicolor (strain S238N-H82 / ATCC MYA-4686) TaxID=486041 RepID=B0D240_LACBS|nr:uncharacterized protein LACBIDRAFT_316152 [Laccaria bicolor S238N-H82]XP_001879161.1 uncharacterized protein LACBIDRAFT_317925 [Laccaria bicolor S238N-H82]EDR09776.1 predicted protein [Laccaria bicolor S238N-H82]EDR11365.1 predicted protein [Laccaria bicolor S238N-H82]|eukprot:XP_001878666.1 predicted protein [Laccaria bicolor S238N-H82]